MSCKLEIKCDVCADAVDVKNLPSDYPSNRDSDKVWYRVAFVPMRSATTRESVRDDDDDGGRGERFITLPISGEPKEIDMCPRCAKNARTPRGSGT